VRRSPLSIRHRFEQATALRTPIPDAKNVSDPRTLTPSERRTPSHHRPMQLFFRPRIQPTTDNPQRIQKHRRHSCLQKKPCTREEAIQRAKDINNSPERRNAVHPYKCFYCEWFHVGRIKDQDGGPNIRLWCQTEYELGDRVWGNFVRENFGADRLRILQIRKRYYRRFLKNTGQVYNRKR
jgi:hypothetical protein